MATKPDPVNDLPPPWADGGNYPPSVYPALLPWGDPNPLGGLPTPWSNQPRLNTTGLTGFASAGLTPQIPTDASPFNEWLRRVQVWAPWVKDGSFSPGADAHIVETDSAGQAGIYAVEVGSPVLFRSSSATGQTEFVSGTVDVSGAVASWTFGVAVVHNATATFNTSAVQLNAGAALAAGQSITGPSTTTHTAGVLSAILRIQLGLSGSSTLDGQLFRDANGFLRYSVSGSDSFVHGSAAGFARSTGNQAAASGLSATTLVTTDVEVAPLATAKMAVTATYQAQRGGAAGTITSVLEQDQGTSTWIAIGSSQTDTVVSDSDANDWTTLTISRDFSSNTTARLYRLKVTSGTTAQVRSARVTAEVTQT